MTCTRAFSSSAYDTVTAVILFEDLTPVSDRTFSLGVGSGIAAYHFTAIAMAESKRDADATTDRDASAIHTQSSYVVGPGRRHCN